MVAEWLELYLCNLIELNWFSKKIFVSELTVPIRCMTLNRRRLVGGWVDIEAVAYSNPTNKIGFQIIE